ncbi:MAG: NBR1-Ig-like domain-containing protein [Planctomycetota bacterium]
MNTLTKYSILSVLLLSTLLIPLSIVYADGTNDADFISQNVPSAMVAGQQYEVSITMENTGDTTWTESGWYRLGAIHTPAGLWNSGRVYLSGEESIAPDQQKTFTFTVTAPSTPGNHNFQWRMVEDAVEWFGDYTTNVVVTVTAPSNDADFISQNVPSSMTAGEDYWVTVTMENTGNTTWTKATWHRLGAQHSPSGLWNSGRVYLTESDYVAPDEQKTFIFQVTAPSTPGNYNFQWRMVEDGVEWFGDNTTNIVVSVSAPQDPVHTVSTIFFSIYYGAQTRWLETGWTPVGGWTAAYDSRDSDWAESEIKDMMAANVDIVFHSMEPFAGDNDLAWVPAGYGAACLDGMQNFFATYRSMVEAGYDPPKVAEWGNLVIRGGHYSATYEEELDLSTQDGEDYFYESFIEPFWSNYFTIMGPYADAHLAKRDGKVLISLDYFGTQDIVGLSNTFLNNIKSRFHTQFGYEVYLLAHPLNDDYAAVDETHLAFGPSTYIWQGGSDPDSKQVIELLPGFWTISDPESLFVTRNGGSGYVSAWQTAIAAKNQVNRLGITSWNFYGEGVQICETSPTPNANAKYSHPGETWGGDSRHYIDITSTYAAQWNDIPGNDAEFIEQDIPTNMVAGQSYDITLTFRNTGDNKWTNADDYQLVSVPTIPDNSRITYIVDTEDEIPTYGGILRGRSKTFEISFKAPSTPGYYTLQWRMIQQNVEWFGDYSVAVVVHVTSP